MARTRELLARRRRVVSGKVAFLQEGRGSSCRPPAVPRREFQRGLEIPLLGKAATLPGLL